MAYVVAAMDNADATSIFVMWRSRNLPFEQNLANIVLPTMLLAMKHENTAPKGTWASSPKLFATANAIAGGHWATKMYIEPSKRACTAPRARSFLSSHILLIPSRAVIDDLLSPSLPRGAVFSPQNKMAMEHPPSRKIGNSMNGPVGPVCLATNPAIWPLAIATTGSYEYAKPKVSLRHAPAASPMSLLPYVSLTIHASGALLIKLVPSPPTALPATSTGNESLHIDSAPKAYAAAATIVPLFRPCASRARPIAGPNNAMEQ
mmetsp:Transcript_15092/g.32955  ORF Transcript_15092/g.32955 Transcript_15092/m.32955 type:complete len:262 (+) Transcript_15092:941-1726(+)